MWVVIDVGPWVRKLSPSKILMFCPTNNHFLVDAPPNSLIDLIVNPNVETKG
jgi:hypothetical protein